MMGGFAAASKVLGAFGFVRIMAAAQRANKAAPTPTRSAEKKRATLVAKTALTPSIWRLEFELDQPIRFAPGQYVKLRVAPFEWRDYSIAGAADARLTLLISNRTHGDGSSYADTVEPGAVTEVEGPLGGYRLERNAHRKVFIATGTGLAPFLPMFDEMAGVGELGAAELYFGCRTMAEDITRALAPLPPRTIVCASRDEASNTAFRGRVTAAVSDLAFDPAVDRFLCLRLGRYGGRLPGDSAKRRRAPRPHRSLLKDRRPPRDEQLLVHPNRSLFAARDRRAARSDGAHAGAGPARLHLRRVPRGDGRQRNGATDPGRSRRASRHEQVAGEPARRQLARQGFPHPAKGHRKPPTGAARLDDDGTAGAGGRLRSARRQRGDALGRPRPVAPAIPAVAAPSARRGRRRGGEPRGKPPTLR